MRHQDRTLRIIGGNWRGRKITFPDSQQIRPTADRVRETLFNWPMHHTANKRFLDLFAGSGILSMEALRRGAAHVSLVDNDQSVTANLKSNMALLDVDPEHYDIQTMESVRWLEECRDQFDVICLDPPFADGSVPDLIRIIAQRNLCTNAVFFESDSPLPASALPHGWQLHKAKRAGLVHYGLCITG